MRKQRDYYVAEVNDTHTVIKCRQKPTYRLRLRNSLAHYVVNGAEPLPKAREVVNPRGIIYRYTSEELSLIRDMRKMLKEVAV